MKTFYLLLLIIVGTVTAQPLEFSLSRTSTYFSTSNIINAPSASFNTLSMDYEKAWTHSLFTTSNGLSMDDPSNGGGFSLESQSTLQLSRAITATSKGTVTGAYEINIYPDYDNLSQNQTFHLAVGGEKELSSISSVKGTFSYRHLSFANYEEWTGDEFAFITGWNHSFQSGRSLIVQASAGERSYSDNSINFRTSAKIQSGLRLTEQTGLSLMLDGAWLPQVENRDDGVSTSRPDIRDPYHYNKAGFGLRLKMVNQTRRTSVAAGAEHREYPGSIRQDTQMNFNLEWQINGLRINPDLQINSSNLKTESYIGWGLSVGYGW